MIHITLLLAFSQSPFSQKFCVPRFADTWLPRGRGHAVAQHELALIIKIFFLSGDWK